MVTKFFSAVLIYTDNAERLGKFYREILNFPLEEEKHGDSAVHYGCEIGDLHFAIHQTKDGKKPGVGAIKLAFEVFDIDKHMQDLGQKNVTIVSQPKDLGFMKLAVIQDPDGNTVEFTELSARWINHLRERRTKGMDLVSEWDRLHKT